MVDVDAAGVVFDAGAAVWVRAVLGADCVAAVELGALGVLGAAELLQPVMQAASAKRATVERVRVIYMGCLCRVFIL